MFLYRLSLPELHHHLKCVNERIPSANQLLRASIWVLQSLRWTKSRHNRPDNISRRLLPDLMKLSAFGTTRIIELTHNGVTSKMIQYVKPHTIPVSIMRINDGMICSYHNFF